MLFVLYLKDCTPSHEILQLLLDEDANSSLTRHASSEKNHSILLVLMHFFFQFSYIQNRCASSTCVMNGNSLTLLQTLRRDNKLESIDRIIIGVKLWLIVCFKFLQLLSVKHVCNLQMYHPANILWKLCILASRCNISITQFMNIPETKGKKLSIFIRQLTS